MSEDAKRSPLPLQAKHYAVTPLGPRCGNCFFVVFSFCSGFPLRVFWNNISVKVCSQVFFRSHSVGEWRNSVVSHVPEMANASGIFE